MQPATRFLYLTGKLLARERFVSDAAIANAASFMGVSSVRLGKESKKGTELSLTYGHYTSQNRFVELTNSLLAGMIKGMHGRNVRVATSVSGKGIYNVRMRY